MKSAAELRAEARKSRRLAASIDDRTTIKALHAWADEADARAEALEAASPVTEPAAPPPAEDPLEA